MNKKNWWQAVDYYHLSALFLLWTASWILMAPYQAETWQPHFNNFWGLILSKIGFSKQSLITARQMPDFITGLCSIFIIAVLHFRKIITVTKNPKNLRNHKLCFTLINLLSITVHTLFFALISKIFLFPDRGENFSITLAKIDVITAAITTACIVGMLTGTRLIARFLMLVLFIFAVFKNISYINSIMGTAGFIVIILCASAFYLEFLSHGINLNNLIIDLSIISGKYENLSIKAYTEGEEAGSKLKNIIKNPAGLSL